MKAALGPAVGNAAPTAAPAAKTIEQQYVKKTQLEHILLRPDSYIGSTQKVTQPMWVLDSAAKKIVNKSITFVPGLYKIFDEILVNAADNKQRDASMNGMQITLDPSTNAISVWNNGKGIPVAMHEDHKMWVPELIFGHLLTSSNYDDDEKKVTGGRNGYGAKLANIFSTEFVVEAADGARSKKLVQTWRGNMGGTTGPALITSYSGPDFTRVTFKPDLKRFGMSHLDDDTCALLSKRVYDMAGTLGKGVAVRLNGAVLPVTSFSDYVVLHQLTEGAPRVSERINERWEVCATLSEGSFMQVSFVNSIATTNGGQHVAYIADKIAAAVAEHANKKNKGVDIKPLNVKNHLFLFVNCLITNPAFDSQTKETLTTRPKDFGSSAELSEKFIKGVLASGIVERVLSWAKFKATVDLQKHAGGKKAAGRLLDVPKLDDANLAGTARGGEATLILTEGDSAKSLAIAGLSVVGRDYYGVFPLKGKLLNVREASHKAIAANAEIQNIVKIMGLRYGQVYESTKGLRYGHLMIMSDQDHDGSHIKGLVLNMLHHFWPSLLRIRGFLREFITPIVKVSKGKTAHAFFTLPEYYAWKDTATGGGAVVGGSGSLRGWAIKYYKGLGTSTAAEAKEYFSDLGTHVLDFAVDDPLVTGFSSDDLIDLAFSKKRADDRKEWLRRFEPGTFVDYGVESMLISDFIHKELILFSMADNIRSIPSLLDGLKPAQRKVLFGCFKRGLKADIKVAQLAGYVSEHAAYHHGEVSLAGTIVGMAQTFVGSNNIALLVPSGQFGTRLMGGKDAASARYIFTRLASITRALFHPDDDALLEYLDDDGMSIEPKFYLPIIPLVLVNGAEGIGTGWSTFVPNYNPRDIITALRARIAGDVMPILTPWYRGFKGSITPKTEGAGGTMSFVTSGVAHVNASGETLTITELPVGKWTQDYKTLLVEMVTGEKADKDDGPTAKGGKAAKAKSAGGKGVVAIDKAAAAAAKVVGAKKTVARKNKASDNDDSDDDDDAPKKKRAPPKKAPVKKASTVAVEEDTAYSAAGGGGIKPSARAAKDKSAAAAVIAAAAAEAMDSDDDADSAEEDESDESDSDASDSDADRRRREAAKKASAAGAVKAAAKPAAGPAVVSLTARARAEREAFVALLPVGGEPLVRDFEENHTDLSVSFTVHTTAAAKALMASALPTAVEGGSNKGAPHPASAHIKRAFKLEGSISGANMHLFDASGLIKRYATPGEVLEEFYGHRMAAYVARRTHLLSMLGTDAERAANKVRFITAVISRELIVGNRKKAELLAELHDAGYKGFDPLPGSAEDDAGAAGEGESGGVGTSGGALPVAILSRRYAYLLSMPLWSLTGERVAALRTEMSEKAAALAALRALTPASLWLRDLDALERALDDLDVAYDAAEAEAEAKARGGKAARAKGAAARNRGPKLKAKGRSKKEWDSDEEEEDDEDEWQGAVPAKSARVGGAPRGVPAPAAMKAAAVAAAAVAPALSVEDDSIMLSLAERLAQRAAIAAGPAVGAAPIKRGKSDERSGGGVAVKAASASSPLPKKAKQQQQKAHGGGGTVVVAVPKAAAVAATSRPGRAAAKKVVYVESDEEGGGEEESEEAGDSDF